MNMAWQRITALLVAILLSWCALPGTAARAEEPAAVAYPSLTEDGFLAGEGEQAEFIHADSKGGRWVYISPSLKVEIQRHKGKVEGRSTVWFVSDIHARDDMTLRAFCASPEEPGKEKSRPEYIAQNHRVVYAQNGDLWTWRSEHKRYTGVIIRDGRIIREKTYDRMVEAQPPLDELALFPDGRVEVRYPGELTGAQYLALGARDVFAFGPILIKDGVTDERVTRRFRDAQPRSAIGMVAPGHYVGVMVEGRTKRSYGTSLQFVADLLREKGCQLAFNLDGGQTSAMVFMGELVMQEPTYNGFTNTRRQPDIIGIGTSEAVKVFQK